MSRTVKHLATCKCTLGEGPVWLPDTQTLAFVDIIGKRLLSWNSEKELADIALSQRVGSVVATETETLLAASERGLFELNPENGFLKSIGHDELIPDANLMNDGKCDRQGRFIFGSKALNEADVTGALMSFDGESVKSWQSGIVLNGPAFSPDGTRIYFADSPTQKILTAEYDPDTGDIGRSEIFVTLPRDAGYPDGMTVDAEGCLWNAHWDGWRISRYSPNGTLLEEIEMPVAKPTSVAFGGPDMNTLFVTSAQTGRAEDAVDPKPMEGDLFSIQTDIVGLTEPKFTGVINA